MAFYAGRVIREPAIENPTLVVITDRNDLDDQLFGTFSRCSDLLRQPRVRAESRSHLRELLSVAAGGVVFTTIRKFLPEEKGARHPTLSERRNVVVIADEARSQYDFLDDFARHMRDALPHASFIGFTGTPIELEDENTRAVFGDYISVSRCHGCPGGPDARPGSERLAGDPRRRDSGRARDPCLIAGFHHPRHSETRCTGAEGNRTRRAHGSSSCSSSLTGRG